MNSHYLPQPRSPLGATPRRCAYGLGAAAVLAAALAGPASARPEPPVYNTWTTGVAASTNPAARPYNPGPPSYNTWPHQNNAHSGTSTVSVAGNAGPTLQYVQIGLGAVGGAALAAAGALTAARGRRTRLAHA